MPISNDLLSSTLYSIRDGEVDQLFQKTAFLDHAKSKGGVEYEDGGIKIQRALALEEHSSITQLASGYEPVSLAVRDTLRPATYEWTDFVAPIVITKKEELENSGEKAVIKILEARMRSVMSMLRRELNRQILVGSSTILTDMNTLNGGVSGGFLEAITAGSQANSVGGISKDTYSGTTGWQNQAVDIQGAFGTNGILAMQSAYQRANARAHMGEVDLVLLSEAGLANYRRALHAQERYISNETLDGGRMSLAFGGAVVEQDLELGFEVTNADFLNDGSPAETGVITGYMLNFDGIKLCMHKDADFAISPFEAVSGSTARAAQLYVKCQLIADHLGSQAVLFDGETYA